MKRSPIKRKRPKDADAVTAFREAVLTRAKFRCEAGPKIITVDVIAGHRCRGQATVAHHVITRGMGGNSPHDPNDGIAVDEACHGWIHQHVAQAYELGLLRRHT